jgi:hypothetical protein
MNTVLTCVALATMVEAMGLPTFVGTSVRNNLDLMIFESEDSFIFAISPTPEVVCVVDSGHLKKATPL